MENFCVILHQIDIKTQATQKELHLQAKNLCKNLQEINLAELGIGQGYLFTCKVSIFVLYVGYLIPFTGWNERLKSIIEERLNHKTDEKITFIDHTYKIGDDTSRRLRSIGGALRRIVDISKKEATELTLKQIFRYLKDFLIVITEKTGQENQLSAQLFAVQYNKKLILK